MNKEADFSDLLGLTLKSCTSDNEDFIRFEATDGRRFILHHHQDCCERVTIDSIVGDLKDLVGNPILLAEEASSYEMPEDAEEPEYTDSYTWTFYKLTTIKGSVDIRWYGQSNGYYSERVDFEEETGQY